MKLIHLNVESFKYFDALVDFLEIEKQKAILATNKLAIATGTYTQTNIGGNYIYTFTGSGTITF